MYMAAAPPEVGLAALENLMLWTRDDAKASLGQLKVPMRCIVSEMRPGEPITPGRIIEATGLPADRVDEIVEDLERNLTFLFRTDGRRVDWAYPVTAVETPHRVRLDSGERLFGA